MQLIELLQKSALFVWKDWPKMEISQYGPNGFVLRGECPHCQATAAFIPVTGTHEERDGAFPTRMIEGAQCLACNEFILAIAKCEPTSHVSGKWMYDAHFPVGWPDDAVAEEIPTEIKPDFQEALRCRWVKAYNATIEMCGRALEASCIQQGAPSDAVLSKMIEWVHEKGKITTPLRDMAHKIKLGRNLAAHAQSDRTLTEQDADAVIEFTRQYFHYVYVMPERMEQFDFDKKKK
jgi:hypothetical protein